MTSDILIIGLGQIGSIVAAHFLAAGYPVTGATHHSFEAEYIWHNGLHISGLKEIEAAIKPVPLHTLVAAGKTYSQIFVCTKATVNERLVSDIQKLLAPAGVLACLQNGLDSEAVFANNFTETAVFRGVLNFAGMAQAPGQVRMTYMSESYLGAVNQAAAAAGQELADLINSSGILMSYSQNIAHAAWEKTLLGAPISIISALTGQTIGQVLACEHTRHIVEKLLAEMIATAAACGEQFPGDFPAFFEQYNLNAASHVPSMRGDVEAGRVTESAFTIGKILQMSIKNKIAAPTVKIIADLLMAIDEKNA